MFVPITILLSIALIYYGIIYAAGQGSLFMIIVFGASLLNQGLWFFLERFWPNQVTKVTWTYCLIHEILTPLLMFNLLGLHIGADDNKIYEWWIDMNFIVANIVAFNDLKITLLL